jgi:hypothetical protein
VGAGAIGRGTVERRQVGAQWGGKPGACLLRKEAAERTREIIESVP